MIDRYPQYFNDYISMFNRAVSDLFTVDGLSKKEKQRKIVKELGSFTDKFKIARDMVRAWKVMK